MNTQARRVADYLHAKRDTDIAGWLTGLRSLLAAEASLQDETVADLVDRARPRWGVKSPEEARAYVELWDWLVERFPVPALIGARSDVLYLLGGPARRSDVLVEFSRAVKAAPELFVKYAGDFSDLAENSAPEERLLFELSKVRFYAHQVDQEGLDEQTLRDAVQDLLRRYADRTDVRAELHAIAMTSLRRS